MGNFFLIEMATGSSGFEIGCGEYIGCHHDSKCYSDRKAQTSGNPGLFI